MTVAYPQNPAITPPMNGIPPCGSTLSPRRHWSSDEYYRLYELGFFEGERVQLINGEIIEMAAMNGPHATATNKTRKLLERIFEGDGAIGDYTVRCQMPISLPNNSVPEPDVAVVEGNDDDYIIIHPRTAALVVEISDTTLHPDQNAKVALYAAAGIAEYWIVNLKERQLEVRRQPTPRAENEAEYFYSQILIFQENESVAPLAASNASIEVAALLPKRN